MNKPPKGTPEHREWVAARLVEAASDLGVNVADLPRKLFREWAPEYGQGIHEGDLRIYGWAPIRAYAWDKAGDANETTPTPEELGQRRAVNQANRHRRALERHLGDVEYIYEKLASALEVAVQSHPPILRKLPNPPINIDTRRTDKALVAHISDTHFGLLVDPEEVIHNQYNWTIAARRMGRYCYRVAQKANNQYSTLHLVLNGDIIEGKIHNDDNGAMLLASQCDGSRQILTSMIDFFRTQFDEIFVECTSGNHGRWPFKGPGRATAQKYDSSATLIYRGLEQIFRDVPEVTFTIPKTPFTCFDVCGHMVFATHGDTVVNIGNPGKSLNLDNIVRQVLGIQVSEILPSRPDIVMLGHYHVPSWFRIPNGPTNSHLMINGSGSGLSPFANSIGLYSGTPVQTFFIVSKEKAVDGFHMVNLNDADGDEMYEQIVPVPHPLGVPQTPQAYTTDFYSLMDSLKK
jgi:hypothetical protein